MTHIFTYNEFVTSANFFIFFRDSLHPYMKQVFLLLFQRLSSSKTVKFVKGLIVFFAYYILKYGATNFVSIIDQIQPQ